MDKKTDFLAFSSIWVAALDTYRRSPSRIETKLAFGALSKWTLKEVISGIEKYLSDPDAEYAPKPGDINRMLRGDAGDMALLAWSVVEHAIRHIGPYQSIHASNPVITAVIQDMGGWIKLCELPSERDAVFLSHEFIKRYKGYAARDGITDPVAYLPGIHERDLGSTGYLDKPVIPILLNDRKTLPRLTHAENSKEVEYV